MDRYTFPDNELGRELRASLAASMRKAGRVVREFEETIQYRMLKLEVGKRPDEGKIAAEIKGLRSKPEGK
jgi:hypothetical protein